MTAVMSEVALENPRFTPASVIITCPRAARWHKAPTRPMSKAGRGDRSLRCTSRRHKKAAASRYSTTATPVSRTYIEVKENSR